MNKLAIFVEGQTEQVFVEKLLLEIAGERNIHIDRRKTSSSSHGSQTRLITLSASARSSGKKYYVLLVDCGADNRVRSSIGDNYQGLVHAGFTSIVGLRDGPSLRADIPKLRTLFHYRLPTVPIKVVLVLSIMEIEAWFIAEHTHFLKIHSTLTPPFIKSNVGFDPSCDDMQLRDRPAEDLKRIYQLVGFGYSKNKKHVVRTVESLDYARVYVDLVTKFKDLEILVNNVDVYLN